MGIRDKAFALLRAWDEWRDPAAKRRHALAHKIFGVLDDAGNAGAPVDPDVMLELLLEAAVELEQ